jgi:hypothetical protein
LERTKNVRFNDQVNKKKFNLFAAANGGLVVAFLIGLYIASLFMPDAISELKAALLHPPTPDEIRLTVTPGSVTVPKGTDVTIKAVLTGYDAPRATIHFKYANSKEWSSASMDVDPASQPTYISHLFNLQEQVSYYVDASGKRSDEYKIQVADLPRVEKMSYTYNYPAYTGMPPMKEEVAYDMIALKGTVVDVNVISNQQVKSGRLVFADGKSVPLTPSGDKQVLGKATVDRTTTFRIELTNAENQTYLGLEEYRMQATEDQKPVISFVKPGRDFRALNTEEVFTEAKADDDFGITSLELYYSVNGAKEQKVDLFKASGSTPKEISGTHTFFLKNSR